jgi:hypothetical protein
MRLTDREMATIYAALIAWEDELSEGEKWITSIYDFRDHSPLSLHEVRDLRKRFRGREETVECADMPATWKLFIPTYVGSQYKLQKAESTPWPDFAPPNVPVLIHEADGIRLLLGTHDWEDNSKPDIQIERRPRGWAIFLHPNAGDPIGHLYMLVDGRSYLLPEALSEPSIEIVDEIPGRPR